MAIKEIKNASDFSQLEYGQEIIFNKVSYIYLGVTPKNKAIADNLPADLKDKGLVLLATSNNSFPILHGFDTKGDFSHPVIGRSINYEGPLKTELTKLWRNK